MSSLYNCKFIRLFTVAMMILLSAGVSANEISLTKDEKVLLGSNDEQTFTNLPEPYGANLFAANSNSSGSAGVNPSYQIAIGDRIQLKLWGALQADQVAVVDPQGNIFIPEVGPVSVNGVRAGGLQQHVETAIKRVFFDNVEVYAALLSANTISVFVSGPVKHPGQYAGLSSDSVLGFLRKSGGVDAQRGSYRYIEIIRNGKSSVRVDLYEFLARGYLPAWRFQEGDTILVRPQGQTVTVTGVTRSSFQFEFMGQPSGQQLARYARPRSNVSHVAVKGTRSDGPFSSYLTLQQFQPFRLKDGDEVRFEADHRIQTLDILVEGSYKGQSFYSVDRNTTLQEVLDYIPVDADEADIKSVYIKRKSVAAKQKKLLDESLRRLEQAVLTAPASSDGEASIRAKEAELVLQFVERSQAIKPEGRVVVSELGRAANIRLEDGDIIVIPRQSDIVTVGGEVLLPQAVVHLQGAMLGDYLAKAGGLTERGDPKRILIVKPNGAAALATTTSIGAGDEILVMPKVDAKNMQFAKDITQILYQIGVAARVATGL
ncbi:MAG: polysaccharide biosynthesis/export family protein [bacterium]